MSSNCSGGRGDLLWLALSTWRRGAWTQIEAIADFVGLQQTIAVVGEDEPDG